VNVVLLALVMAGACPLTS